MALNKLKFNSLNVTPAANEAIRFNSSANGLETASAGGSLVKISSSTISSGTSSVSITSGIDSTYKEYLFIFNNIHMSQDCEFHFNLSADGGSNYNVAKTTTTFRAYHNEAGSSSGLGYVTSYDLAQGTGTQHLADTGGSSDDETASGFLHLFDPSNTTFVKHFISSFNRAQNATAGNHFIGGYGNTTSAINAIQFTPVHGSASPTLEAGTITMYGFK